MPEKDQLSIVVTRPAAQADGLCQKLELEGYHVLPFPVMEIQPPDNLQRLHDSLARLDDFDLLIFISANAVNWCLQYHATFDTGQWPASLSIAAIGEATAKAVSNQGLQVTLQAPRPYNSEALLAMAEMQSLHGQRILICRGQDGREYLAQTLRQRGAQVEYADCYQRSLPDSDSIPLVAAWQAGRELMFVVTSNEGLLNLYHMLAETNRKKLLASPIVVLSERALEKARSLGFTQTPVVASVASDDGILQAIQAWFERENRS